MPQEQSFTLLTPQGDGNATRYTLDKAKSHPSFTLLTPQGDGNFRQRWSILAGFNGPTPSLPRKGTETEDKNENRKTKIENLPPPSPMPEAYSGFHSGEVRCEPPPPPLAKGGYSVKLLQPGTGGVGLSNGVSHSMENRYRKTKTSRPHHPCQQPVFFFPSSLFILLFSLFLSYNPSAK